MKFPAAFFESLPSRRAMLPALLGLLVLLFAIANMPWHLDNYDQAKQAYVSFEIVKTGEIWFQHTPRGDSASKPPLMGWCSAALRMCGIPWDLAWRLPPFLCALGILALLAREGWRLLGSAGAVIGAAAFGLNLLTPRLATLVRTDMMLGAFIFVLGWLIYRKLRTSTPWTPGEQLAFFAAMLATLLTKGPVVYAFLLPGLVAFLLIDRGHRRYVWSGWWTWVIPLMLFVGWGIMAIKSDPQFYDDVVDRELLSRFQSGARDDERPQPIWFYFPHLLHKFAPWSILLVVVAFAFPAVRRNLRAHPAMLWLILWSLGGLLVMTLIPAKRVDRIYPVVPPLCLLAVEWTAMLWNDRRFRIGSGVALVAALLFAGGYFLGLVPLSYYERTPAIVEFAEKARQTASNHGFDRVTVVGARDEGLLMYFDVSGFADRSDTFEEWGEGKPMALLLSDRNARKFEDEFGKVAPALDSGELIGKNEKRYLLFIQQ